MIIKLLAEYHMEILSLKGGCRGSSESTHVKMPHCWKSHATAKKITSILYSVFTPVTTTTQSNMHPEMNANT